MTDGDLDALIDGEELILRALSAAVDVGDLDYGRFSPAFDLTLARIISLKLARAALGQSLPEDMS